jgi:hypothetical protein
MAMLVLFLKSFVIGLAVVAPMVLGQVALIVRIGV